MTSWDSKEEFKSAVFEWADKLGVRVNTLALRPMRTKWASCSGTGNLNFNAELLQMERQIGNYIIVHELLHFSVPNHGRLWKSLMLVHLGDYEKIAASLPKFERLRS